ncbi:hypothetical protein T265_02225 [Opisthorchis viverrini]|uniref:Uncharacterized protein n=1 Tax=Opisthorchis viverrini TaxID=6198 RepID=A0A074ZVU8_OPIVI|nr:hypothetical protein T265_02225 [Opisthorchis viverrini]KER31588.1 hypothetical protein T265_02225 [Opisthorchis viverrini]
MAAGKGRSRRQIRWQIPLRQSGQNENEQSTMLRITGDRRSTDATRGVEGTRAHHGAAQQGDTPCRKYRPLHGHLTPRECYQICKAAYHHAVITVACTLIKNSRYQTFYPFMGELSQ